MDNISNKNKTINGFSLYYLTSALLAVALFFTNWIGGAMFLVAWFINFYLWSTLTEELEGFPDLDESAVVPLILKRFNWGNLFLTAWASILVLAQIFFPNSAWLVYPLALAPFAAPFWALKTARRVREIIEDLPLGVSRMQALEKLAQIDTLILDEATTGQVLVEDILLAEGIKEELFGKIIGTFLQAHHAKDSVIAGLNARFKHAKTYPVKNIMMPSAERTWSSMYLESIGTVFLGPAETVLSTVPDFVIQTIGEGKRVLALAVSQDEHNGKDLPESLFTIALLVLSEPLQTGLSELCQVLANQNTQLKILTSEDPIRIGNLCRHAGLKGISQEEAVFGHLTNLQKSEAAHWLAESQEVAYVGDLGLAIGCRISGDVNTQPDLLLPEGDLGELAAALENSLDEIRKLLAI